MAYNPNLAPVPHAQPSYGQSQLGYGGENPFPGYSSGYAGYSNAGTQYPGQWNTSGGYAAQGAGQTATGYDIPGYQGMNGTAGGYGYGSQNLSNNTQGYSYGGQGYQDQTFGATGGPTASSAGWNPNQSAWSGASADGGDLGQGGFGQSGGPAFGRGGSVAAGRGISRGRGDSGMGGGRGKPSGGVAEGPGRGWGFADRGQEFGSGGSYPRGGGLGGRGRGDVGGRVTNLGRVGDDAFSGRMAQDLGQGFGDQGQVSAAPRGRGGFSERGRGMSDRGRGGPGRGQSMFGRGSGTSEYGIGLDAGGMDYDHGRQGQGVGDINRGGPGRGEWGAAEMGRGLGSGMFSDRGRGRDGGDGGRGDGNRGSGFGRGGGDRGSSFGRGGGDRGRGGGDRGRVGGDRGRGFGSGGSDRGRGFGSGGADRGRGGGDRSGFGRGGGDRGSNFGRGGGDRGRGSDRGRGGSGRGGGGGDRGRGGGDRGRGFGRSGDRGRGGGDRGRGGGDRGRGGGRGGGDRGQGGGRGRGSSSGGGAFDSKTFLTSSSGVGLSSLGDVIKSAKSRQFSKPDVQPCVATDSLTKLVEHWQAFTRTFTDCGNAITTMECSLTASKVRFIRLYYTARSLTQCHSYCIFTGSLYLNKVLEDHSEDGVFLARGLGMTKKNAKLDAYQKAYNLLMNATVAEIMSQEDTNDHALIEEVTCLFEEDPDGFMALLKKSSIEGEVEGTQAMVTASMKRPAASGGAPNHPPKRPRMSQEVASMLEASSTSLVPKKQTELVMSPMDPLIDKLTKLKELLKEEGITKLHIVPKIDQLGNKSAMNIKNVYRFLHPPMRGQEPHTPVFCEIYFDNVRMSSGDPSVKRTAAMHSAYTLLAERLCKEPLDSIVHCSSYWKEYMACDPDVCQVIVKRAGEDNDSLLTSNLANMKQMMQCNPNFSNSIDRFVLMEFEADTRMENSYKMLELSATRNCMLLECEIVRNEEQRFTCMISMQGRQLSIRTSTTKNGAKRLCSDAILNKLNRTNDIVFVGKGVQGPVYTRTGLMEEAKKAKEAGVEPLKCNLKKEDVKVPPFKTAEQEARWEEDRKKAKEIDNLLENVLDRPFIPWMGRILADKILEYHKRVTLDDLRVHLHDMPKSMRDMVQIVSSRLGLRTVSKLRDGENAILRRSIPALEVTKILGVNNGESGRFKLKQCKNPWSAKELEEYKNEIITKYTKMYEELLNDTDAEAEPPV